MYSNHPPRHGTRGARQPGSPEIAKLLVPIYMRKHSLLDVKWTLQVVHPFKREGEQFWGLVSTERPLQRAILSLQMVLALTFLRVLTIWSCL
jgi:hypothetical protein